MLNQRPDVLALRVELAGPRVPQTAGEHAQLERLAIEGVCQELRADESIKDTLVLMLTAKGRDTDVDKGLGVGADAYMTKPFSTKELAAKVAEMLGAAP